MAQPPDQTLIGGAYAKGYLRVPVKTFYRNPLTGITTTTITYKMVYVVAKVIGDEIKIDPLENDIEEAAIITNKNFHTMAAQIPLNDTTDIPGPMSDYGVG